MISMISVICVIYKGQGPLSGWRGRTTLGCMPLIISALLAGATAVQGLRSPLLGGCVLDSQLIKQETELVGFFFNLFVEGGAEAVSGGR